MKLYCHNTSTASSINPGNLIFRNGTSNFDNFVKWWTSSEISHCGIIYTDTVGIKVFQCVSTGVGPVTLDHFLSLGKCSLIPLQVDWTTDTTIDALALDNAPYSYLVDVAVGLGLTPPNNGGYCCSTLVAKVLTFCGINVPLKGCTPIALANYFTNQGLPLQPLN